LITVSEIAIIVLGLTVLSLIGHIRNIKSQMQEMSALIKTRSIPGNDRVDARIEISLRGNDIFARTEGNITSSGLALSAFLLLKKAMETGNVGQGNVAP